MKKKCFSKIGLICLLFIISFCKTVWAYNTGDDYPDKYKNKAKDAVVDEWNFYNRECTSFTAWCLNSRNGIHFTNQYGKVTRWGNAKYWGSVAKGLGIAVDMYPAVGAVAWRQSGTYGHVAWVYSVNGDKVTVEEYNAGGTGKWRRHEYDVSYWSGYIHIADIGKKQEDPDIRSFYTPLTCYTKETGNVTTYISAVGSSKSGYITGISDKCVIKEVYSNNRVKVTYPLTNGGEKTAYANLSDFISADHAVTNYKYTVSQNTTVYRRSDMAQTIGTTYPTDNIVVVGKTGDKLQIIYNISGGYKLGWIYGTNASVSDQGAEMQSGYNRTIMDGDYAIVSALNTDYFLDIIGADMPAGNGTNVSLWNRYSSGGVIGANNIWTVKYENGFYTLQQKDSSMALDVQSSSKQNKANVQVWTSNSSSGQKWAIKYAEAGNGYTLQAKCSGYYLSVQNGKTEDQSNVCQSVNSSGSEQSWLFIPYNPKQPIAAGRYNLISCVGEHLELDVSGDSGNVPDGQNVQIWNDDALSQFNSFDVVALSDGYYKLVHAASGKALGVSGTSTSFRSNIAIYTDNGSYAQQWAIIPYGDGYVLRSRLSGYGMDLEDFGTEDGSNVVAYPCHGKQNQIWKFVKAEYSVTYDGTGGTGVPAKQIKYYRNSCKLSSSIPVRNGYDFVGWEGAGTIYQPGSNYDTDKDLSLKAKWRLSPSHSIEPGSYFIASAIDNTQIFTVGGANTINRSDVQLWFHFFHAFAFELLVDEEGYYTIKYNYQNCNKVLDCTGATDNGTNIYIYDDYGHPWQRFIIRRDNEGYYTIYDKNSEKCLTAAGGVAANGVKIQLCEANGSNAQKWKFIPALHQITFDPCGGSVDETSRNVYYRNSYGDLPVPIKEGYTFDGWYTEKQGDATYDGGTKIEKDTQCLLEGNQTLYAHWYLSTEESTPDGKLPEGLMVISEEAFMGCDFKYVRLPETVSRIERRAFADCKKMKDIYIPRATGDIADDAFSGTDVRIHGKSGSYAEYYAAKHGLVFIEE